jgi:hypothetical protein
MGSSSSFISNISIGGGRSGCEVSSCESGGGGGGGSGSSGGSSGNSSSSSSSSSRSFCDVIGGSAVRSTCCISAINDWETS